MPDKHSEMFKKTVITVLVSLVLSVGAQALYVWRNDSVQEEKLLDNKEDIKGLEDKKADKSQYDQIQKRLDAIDGKLDRMEKRIDNLADRKR